MGDTNPGYALSSTSFSVKFVCAQQKKIVSYLLEYETDWKEVMEILLASLETFPPSIMRAATLATKKLEAGLCYRREAQSSTSRSRLRSGTTPRDRRTVTRLWCWSSTIS